jgi:hypothetical protein
MRLHAERFITDLDSGKFSEKVRFHKGFRLRTANKDENCSSAYGRRVSGFFKPRILEELPTLQLPIRSSIFSICVCNSVGRISIQLVSLASREPRGSRHFNAKLFSYNTKKELYENRVGIYGRSR